MPAIRTDDSDSGSDSEHSTYLPPKSSRPSGRPYPSKSNSHAYRARRRSQTEVTELSSVSSISSSGSSQLTPEHPRAQSNLVEPITICGVRLHPTVAFDTFWHFAAERKAIDDRRRAGEPAP
jgi:hypothetical protein